MIMNLRKAWDMQFKKRKYLILKATDTLSDDELEDDDDEGSEWTLTHRRRNKLNHGNEEHMILAST